MRIYLPTASRFSQIVTSKGERSSQRESYMNELVDNAFGVMHGSFSSFHTERGTILEPRAIAEYTRVTGLLPKKEHFLVSKCGTAGCYVDGLVNEDGLLEAKCPSFNVHSGYLSKKVFPTTYKQQVQGELFITERLWCDFFSFYPGKDNFLVRVERDEVFISILAEEIGIFHREMLAKIEERNERNNRQTD